MDLVWSLKIFEFEKILVLNWQFLTWIWRPDTYFMNGQDSYLHKVAVPNRFIRWHFLLLRRLSVRTMIRRVAPNGRVSYSQRLTVTAKCKMNLRKFPHDSQSCPLKVASFGHSLSDLVYRWTDKPATLGDIELSQYHFISLDHGQENSSVRDDTRSTIDHTDLTTCINFVPSPGLLCF